MGTPGEWARCAQGRADALHQKRTIAMGTFAPKSTATRKAFARFPLMLYASRRNTSCNVVISSHEYVERHVADRRRQPRADRIRFCSKIIPGDHPGRIGATVGRTQSSPPQDTWANRTLRTVQSWSWLAARVRTSCVGAMWFTSSMRSGLCHCLETRSPASSSPAGSIKVSSVPTPRMIRSREASTRR